MSASCRRETDWAGFAAFTTTWNPGPSASAGGASAARRRRQRRRARIVGLLERELRARHEQVRAPVDRAVGRVRGDGEPVPVDAMVRELQGEVRARPEGDPERALA